MPRYKGTHTLQYCPGRSVTRVQTPSNLLQDAGYKDTIHDLDTIQDADAGVGLPEQRDGWMASDDEKNDFRAGHGFRALPLFYKVSRRGTEIRAPPLFYKGFRRAGHGNPCPAFVL